MQNERSKVLVEQWHPTLNGDMKPSDVKVHSHKKVWWHCKEGHDWKATVSQRSRGTDCPYCAGQRAISGETDLATINPAIVAEWHPTLNGDLKPSDVKVHSHKKVWWRCKEDHEWRAVIYNRIEGNGCPYCAGKRPITGKTDLATINPAISAEWHPSLNGKLKPTDFTAQSGKKVWWRCKEDHEWQAVIYSRTV